MFTSLETNCSVILYVSFTVDPGTIAISVLMFTKYTSPVARDSLAKDLC